MKTGAPFWSTTLYLVAYTLPFRSVSFSVVTFIGSQMCCKLLAMVVLRISYMAVLNQRQVPPPVWDKVMSCGLVHTSALFLRALLSFSLKLFTEFTCLNICDSDSVDRITLLDPVCPLWWWVCQTGQSWLFGSSTEPCVVLIQMRHTIHTRIWVELRVILDKQNSEAKLRVILDKQNSEAEH